MERTEKKLTMTDVAGWGSALVTFGLVQGAFYLKAYWGHFGLDPFQFVAVGELALAGLTGIGMVLFLMLVALLIGGWLEVKLASSSSERKLLAWLAPVLFFAGLGALLWWASAWPVLIGVLLTGVCALAVRLSPIVPSAVKDSPRLIYALVMLVYVSIASSWLGFERARAISSGSGKYTVAVRVDGQVQSGLNLIGRLGDSYALWDQARRTTELVPVGEVRGMEIVRTGAVQPSVDLKGPVTEVL